MMCPKCKGRMKVLEVRNGMGDFRVYRRLRCNECGVKMKSVEVFNDGSADFVDGHKMACKAFRMRERRK